MTPLSILLTNDDGYGAPGLHALHDELAARHRVVVVAPHREQSGISHAFTYNDVVRCREMPPDNSMRGYSVEGTPSDCVKLAVARLLCTRPDIIVSGMNIGENSGMSGHYSGTLAAAREAAFWGIAGAAFSVCEEGAVFLPDYARVALTLVEELSSAPPSSADGTKVFYNVNFPACPVAKSRGIKVTRQSCAFFSDNYRVEAGGPDVTAYRLYGEKNNIESSDEYDSRAVRNGYITVTPLMFDATAGAAIGPLRRIERIRISDSQQEEGPPHLKPKKR